MRSLFVIIVSLFASGCVSYKPIMLDSYESYKVECSSSGVGQQNKKLHDTALNFSKSLVYAGPYRANIKAGKSITIKNSNGTSETKKICTERTYANYAIEAYKQRIVEIYSHNNSFDSSILNLTAIGIGADVSNLHTDVIKGAAIALGYQSARKGYQDIRDQLQTYTNALTSAQCVYSKSRLLEKHQAAKTTLDTSINTLTKQKQTLDFNKTEVDTLIKTVYPQLIGYSEFESVIVDAIKIAQNSYDALESTPSTLLEAIQVIEVNVLKSFNKQLPNMNDITATIRQQIMDNINQGGENPIPPANPTPDPAGKASAVQNKQSQFNRDPHFTDHEPALLKIITTINELALQRTNRFIKLQQEVRGCAIPT